MQAEESTVTKQSDAEEIEAIDAEEVVEEAASADVETGEAIDGEAIDAEEAAPPTIEDQLAAAQAEAGEYKDRWLRGQAEFANARKRMERQRIELYGTAAADVMQKLLPVVDDYDRAMATVPAELTDSTWLEGIQLVQKKLAGILENFNVVSIEAVGQPFDPNVHDAISQEPSAEYESGTVSRELQKGYKIGDKVIRPSLVVVVE